MYWTVWGVQMVNEATGKPPKWQPGSGETFFYLSMGLETYSHQRVCILLSSAMKVRCTSHYSVTMKQVRGLWCWRIPSWRKSSSRWRRTWSTSWVHARPLTEEPVPMTARSRCLFGIKMNLNMYIQSLDGLDAWNHHRSCWMYHIISASHRSI